MKPLRYCLTLLMTLLAIMSARANVADTTVSFTVFYPGPDIYELEGHAALHITTPQADYAVSFGTFDFEQPNFVYRFVKGETDYWAAAAPWQYFADAYSRQGRRIVDMQLDLTPQQKAYIIDLCIENLKPENRVYRYNYVKDNCATRPLGLLEKALAPDSLQLGKVQTVDSSHLGSFRSIMRYYHRNYPWYQFGIDLALGSGIDYPISLREQAFAPVLIAEQLQGATTGGRPLVSHIVEVNPQYIDATAGPTPWLLSPMCVSALLLAITLIVTWRDIRRMRVNLWFDTVLFGMFGLAGCMLTFLIFISVHEATSPNFLYMWLNPFCLIPVIFIWIKKCKKLVLCYHFTNFALVFAMAACWLWLPQSANTAFIPLILCDMTRSVSYIYITNFKRKQ